MELLRPTLFLFLILSLHSFPGGRSWRVLDSESSGDTYEIDYRGPETHSSTPPPRPHHTHSSPSIQGEENPKMKKPHK